MPSTPLTTPKWQYIGAYILGTLFFLYAFVHRVSPSVMTDDLMRDFSIGAAGIGLLSGAYFYTYALMQLPVGVLLDRLGPRKLMSAAALFCALASTCMAHSESLLVASVSRAVVGATVAFSFVGTLAVAATFFRPAVFSILTGVLMATGMIGAIAGQTPLKLLIDFTSWRFTFDVLAIIALILSVLLFVIVPRRPALTIADEQNTPSILSGLRVVMRNPQSWLSAGAGFGLTATMLSFSGLWAVPWMINTRGIPTTEAATVASTLFFGVMIGAPLMGWLTDKTGRRKPVLVVGSFSALATILLIGYAGYTSSLVLSGLFFCAGLAASTMVATFAICRESNPPRYSATALGLVNMCVVGSGAVMQPVIGALLDSRWRGELLNGARIYTDENFKYALVSLVISSFIALICALLIKETYCQQLGN